MNSMIPDDLLSAFLDRELTAAEEAAVSKHLKSSPQARQELQDYQRLSELLQELPRRTVPAEFASSVMQRAERETLIPLDPVATVDRRSSRRKLSRRALALTAVGVVAASIALLMIVDRPRPQREVAFVANTLEVNGPQGHDLRTALKGSANLPAAAASPAQAAAPVAVAENTAGAATILGVTPALKRPAAKSKQAKVSASPEWGLAREGNGAELVLPTDLKKAKVGDVIEAMEKVGDQVAVVRLKVVDQSDGLGQLRSLLVREPARIGQKQGTILANEKETIRNQTFDYQKNSTAGDQGQMAKNKAGELICVFIEESPDELAGLLKDMQAERPFQQAELTNTISVAKLSQYANQQVPLSTAAHSTSHPPTVLSLPATAVNQIYADNRQIPAASDKKSASPQEMDSLGLSAALKSQAALARKNATTGTAFGEDHRVVSADKDVQSLRHLAGTPTQRPIQVFFVLDDQSIAQSESEAASKVPTALPALESQSDKPLHPRPVKAHRPAKHRSAPSQKAE